MECAEGCPCSGTLPICVYTSNHMIVGTCKPVPEEGKCWSWRDCDVGQFCWGPSPCAYGEWCAADNPGTCMQVTVGCCDLDNPCPDRYFCMDMGSMDTCHGSITPPDCWTDEDCMSGTTCQGALLSHCSMASVSTPGICSAP